MNSLEDGRETFLQEVYRLDGLVDDSSRCAVCQIGLDRGIYRCLECFGGYTCCRDCLLMEHRFHPLHVVEVCNFLFSRNHIIDECRNGQVAASRCSHWRTWGFAFN